MQSKQVATTTGVSQRRFSLLAHIQIARVDHWFKNVFALPGIVVALSLDPAALSDELPYRILIGLMALCLVASSNYVLNEVVDAPYDRHHPMKRYRSAAMGKVNIPFAYVQWIVLMLIGVSLGTTISNSFMLTLVAFWTMGCVYNLPPLRSKDLPYLDVLSEALNNPIRLLAGWFMVGTPLIVPISLLISYWMIGSYFMAMKRFAEFRQIGDPVRAAAYRRSFVFYNENRLLISIMFYGSSSMLFLGSFIIRYRLELILSYPLVAIAMAYYLALGLLKDSPVEKPEELYKQKLLVLLIGACALFMGVLVFVDIPLLYELFRPSVP